MSSRTNRSSRSRRFRRTNSTKAARMTSASEGNHPLLTNASISDARASGNSTCTDFMADLLRRSGTTGSRSRGKIAHRSRWIKVRQRPTSDFAHRHSAREMAVSWRRVSGIARRNRSCQESGHKNRVRSGNITFTVLPLSGEPPGSPADGAKETGTEGRVPVEQALQPSDGHTLGG